MENKGILSKGKKINEYCISWEEDGVVEYEDISHSRFIEETTGLKVKLGNWKRLRFDDPCNKILVSTNISASLVRKNQS